MVLNNTFTMGRMITLYFSVLCLFLGLMISISLNAQSLIGSWEFKVIDKSVYGGGTQNWECEILPSGQVAFANNEGLMISNSCEDWDVFPVPNSTIVRSLTFDERSRRLYLGAQNEFGYMSEDKFGVLRYTSLSDSLDLEQVSLEDIWDIVKVDDGVCFRSRKHLITLKGNELEVKDFEDLKMLQAVDGTLFYQDGNELIIIRKDQEQISIDLERPDMTITDIESFGFGRYILSSIKSGVFLLKDSTLSRWPESSEADINKGFRLNALKVLNDNMLAFGTALNGLIITDTLGTVIHRLDVDRGLENNSVLCMNIDDHGDLWLGMENGITYVQTGSAHTKVFPDGVLKGTGYDLQIYANKVFTATNTGLYVTDWFGDESSFQDKNFSLVEGSVGLNWGLDTLSGELFVSHHEGGFVYSDQGLVLISDKPGFWKFIKPREVDDYLIAGTYEGLVLFKKEGNEWVDKGYLEGLDESCRIIEEDENGTIWMAHPYKGLYKVLIDYENERIEHIKMYGSEEGFPSNLHIHVQLVNDDVLFSTELGLYKYDQERDSMIIAAEYASHVDMDKRYLAVWNDLSSNIWLAEKGNLREVRVERDGLKSKVTINEYPSLSRELMGGFENLSPVSEDMIFFGNEKGFTCLDLSDSVNISLNRLTIKADFSGKDSTHITRRTSLLNDDWAQEFSLPSDHRDVRFKFFNAHYKQREEIEYSSRLLGNDDVWSSWSTRDMREFTNLHSGGYTLEVRSRVKGRHDSISSTSLSFVIGNYFYESEWFKVLIAVLILVIFAVAFYIPSRRFEKKQQSLQLQKDREIQHLEILNKKEIEKTEAEMMKLKNENLKSEVDFKNKELASATLHLVQKGKILVTIREELNKLTNKYPDLNPQHIKRIIKIINDDVKLDNSWSMFAQNFDRVHVDFLKRLKVNYPDLTPNDQKLCAYLRMNLSTKEIASIMNISVRGVEIGRYRLRKKLDLETDVNLSEFIMSL